MKEKINVFVCCGCGTEYLSSGKTPPPGIRWSDGHVCNPKPLADKKS